MTSAREQITESLADKEYRDHYVVEHIGQDLAFQIRAMRKDRGWSQAKLGGAVGMKQARISRLEDPDYDSFSLTTLKRLASAFDVGLMVRFVPFSQLVDWSVRLTHVDLAVPSFADDAGLHRQKAEQTQPRMLRPGDTIEAIQQPLRFEEFMTGRITSWVSRGRAPATRNGGGHPSGTAAIAGRWG